MANLDTLNVTDLGLLNINKKIINSRIFSGNLITSVGTPIISNGIASGFSQENYFTYSPITFTTPEKISISFKGTFVAGETQCAFKLINSSNEFISLIFKDKSAELLFNSQKLFSFSFSIEDETDILVSVTLKSNSYEFVMYSENRVIQKVESIPFTLPISTFSILNLGNDTTNTENFWMGSINLKEFFIYEDNEVIYTPSIGEDWTFSNILVSDGSFPLTNSTTEAAGHVYSFDVKEISRSGSTVLLTCQIDDDAYLIIKEIGLYLKTKQGKVLFGSISGLNIDKTKGVPYDLILNVNTSISVVNAVGFPAENEIIVEDPDFIEFKDFDTVQQVNAYVLTNLERIIRMNAGAKGSYENSSIINNQAGIGHNRPQIIYRLQQKIEEGENCYNSVDTFVQLVEALEYIEEEQINFETVAVGGNATLLPNGEASGFSQDSYIEKQLYFTDTSEWALTASLHTESDIPHGQLLSLGNEEGECPLGIWFDDDGQCYLQIKQEESINPTQLNSYYIKSPSNNLDSEMLYAWKRMSSVPCYYFHCTNLPISNSPLVTFPQSQLIETRQLGNLDPTNFTLSLRVKFNSIETQCIIGKQSNILRASIELLLVDGFLKAIPYDSTDRSVITNNLVSRYKLKADTYYNIELSYNGEKYSLHYESEPNGNEYIDTETINIYSSRTVSFNDDLIIGDTLLPPQDIPPSIVWKPSTNNPNLSNYHWSGIAYDGNRFVAISYTGYVSTSVDGETWSAATYNENLGNNTWTSLSYGNGKFVAIGYRGYVSTSVDGETWSEAEHNENLARYDNVEWKSVTFDGTKFIALESGALMSTSVDGETWSLANSTSNLDPFYSWQSIAYGNGKYVALSGRDYCIYTSNDGISWTMTSQNLIPSGWDSWKSIVYSGSQFIALNGNGFTTISEDGEHWSSLQRNTVLNRNYGWSSIGYGNGVFVMMADSGGTFSTATESYSLNGTIDFSNFNISSNPSWNSLSDLSLIYTNDRYPFTGAYLYDSDNYNIIGSYVRDYTNGNIIDEHDIFQLLPNNNYTIDIAYSENDTSQLGTYTMDVTTNETTERVLSRSIPIAENYSNRMLTPSIELVGVNFLYGTLTRPYSSSLNLLNWNITQGESNFPFSHEVVLNSTNLIQYYNLPESRNLQYATHDLCNLDNKIRFLSNKFEGNKDIIDFSYPEGLTLCMKVDLKDSTPKVALYKSDLYNDVYFSLTLLNQTLTFSLLTSEGIVELSKPLDITEYSAYVDYPILVTIIAVKNETSLSLKMYRNNTLIDSTEGIVDSAVVDPSMFVLSNYIENMPTYEVEEDGERVIKTVEPAKYVEDIIVIKGAISEKELFYINNLMNTNF